MHPGCWVNLISTGWASGSIRPLLLQSFKNYKISKDTVAAMRWLWVVTYPFSEKIQNLVQHFQNALFALAFCSVTSQNRVSRQNRNVLHVQWRAEKLKKAMDDLCNPMLPAGSLLLHDVSYCSIRTVVSNAALRCFYTRYVCMYIHKYFKWGHFRSTKLDRHWNIKGH